MIVAEIRKAMAKKEEARGERKLAPEDLFAAAHKPRNPSDVTLIARDETIVAAFVMILEKFEEENG